MHTTPHCIVNTGTLPGCGCGVAPRRSRGESFLVSITGKIFEIMQRRRACACVVSTVLMPSCWLMFGSIRTLQCRSPVSVETPDTSHVKHFFSIYVSRSILRYAGCSYPETFFSTYWSSGDSASDGIPTPTSDDAFNRVLAWLAKNAPATMGSSSRSSSSSTFAEPLWLTQLASFRNDQVYPPLDWSSTHLDPLSSLVGPVCTHFADFKVGSLTTSFTDIGLIHHIWSCVDNS